MSGYGPFSKTHWLPWSRSLNDSQITHLLKSVTQDDLFKFFSVLNAQYRKQLGADSKQRMFVALDSTSISTYSNKLSQADYGHNKDGDCIKQINYLLVCDEVTGAPIYGKTYKGNVVDVSTVKRLMIDLENVFKYNNADDEKPNLVFVTDRGYDSSKNLQDFLVHGYSFVMRSKINSCKWVRDIIEESFKELLDDNNHDEFYREFMFTKKVEYKYDAYPIEGKRRTFKDSKEVYVHMYFNETFAQEQRKNIRFNINSARSLYNEKVKALHESNESFTAEELSKINIGSLQEFIDIYCVFDADGYAKIDMDKLEAKLKFTGFMALISDCVEDAKMAYFAYKQRQQVERSFESFKSMLKFNRPYVSDDGVFQGKFLCQFIASAIAVLFNTRIKQYEKTADARKDQFRLTQYSLSKVLAELNTIMLTVVKGGFYFDEIAGKYRYLYKALGIDVPEFEYKYKNDDAEAIADEEPYETPDPEFVAIAGEEL